MKMKKGVLNLAVILAAVSVGVGLSLKPWRVYAKQKQSTQQHIQEMRKVERQHIYDLQQEAKIGTTLGREELARQQGFHRADEVPIGNKAYSPSSRAMYSKWLNQYAPANMHAAVSIAMVVQAVAGGMILTPRSPAKASSAPLGAVEAGL